MIYTKEKIKKENEKILRRRKVLKWVFTPVIILIIVTALYVGYQKLIKHNNNVSIFGFQQYVIMTGSMSPQYEAGDLIVVRKSSPTSIHTGDVITYAAGTENTVTHRVIEVVNQGGTTYYRTKGDGNNTSDGDLIPYSQVQGKAIMHFSKVGQYINKFLTGLGSIVVFIVVFLSYSKYVHEEERMIAREEARKKYNTCKYKKETKINDSL